MSDKAEADDYGWMNETEQAEAAHLTAELRAIATARGVDTSPLLLLRIGDLVVAHAVARRGEQTLLSDPAEDPKSAAAAYDVVGKLRERLRKSLREFEDYCDRAGAPVKLGIADEMQPLMERTKGLMERLWAEAEDDGVPLPT